MIMLIRSTSDSAETIVKYEYRSFLIGYSYHPFKYMFDSCKLLRENSRTVYLNLIVKI